MTYTQFSTQESIALQAVKSFIAGEMDLNIIAGAIEGAFYYGDEEERCDLESIANKSMQLLSDLATEYNISDAMMVTVVAEAWIRAYEHGLTPQVLEDVLAVTLEAVAAHIE